MTNRQTDTRGESLQSQLGEAKTGRLPSSRPDYLVTLSQRTRDEWLVLKCLPRGRILQGEMRVLSEGQTWEFSQGSPSERGVLSGLGGLTDEPPSADGLRKQQA